MGRGPSGQRRHRRSPIQASWALGPSSRRTGPPENRPAGVKCPMGHRRVARRPVSATWRRRRDGRQPRLAPRGPPAAAASCDRWAARRRASAAPGSAARTVPLPQSPDRPPKARELASRAKATSGARRKTDGLTALRDWGASSPPASGAAGDSLGPPGSPRGRGERTQVFFGVHPASVARLRTHGPTDARPALDRPRPVGAGAF